MSHGDSSAVPFRSFRTEGRVGRGVLVRRLPLGVGRLYSLVPLGGDRQDEADAHTFHGLFIFGTVFHPRSRSFSSRRSSDSKWLHGAPVWTTFN